MGYVQETPYVAGQLGQLGVSTEVWDEVLEELRDSLSDYGKCYHSRTPPALNDILFDLRPRLVGSSEDPNAPQFQRQFDYTRGAEQTDRGYVAGLLKQVDDVRVKQQAADAALIAASGRRVVDDSADEQFDWEANGFFNEGLEESSHSPKLEPSLVN